MFALKGGCAKRCLLRLLYKHSCLNMCYSTSLHNTVRYLKRCLRTKKGYKHKCLKPYRNLYKQKC